MPTATKRAEIVAGDESIAERFRDYLEGLHYAVEVKREVEPTSTFDVDIVIYHVSPDAARAERRHKARLPRKQPQEPPRFWLEALRLISERAPAVPILVSVPAGGDAADKALDSGATDVIEGTVSPKIFRRRLEMLEAFYRKGGVAAPTLKTRRGAQRRPGVLKVPLAELRNQRSGRIDAQRVADYLGIPLRRLADAIEVNYAGLHKTPDAPRVQERLRTVVRVLEMTDAAFGNREQVRMWLHRPLAELENDSPLAVILAGEAGAVETLLENARSGIPG